MRAHWTERSPRDYVFRIMADFITQLENKLSSLQMSQNDFAEKLNISKGRASQILNNFGNIRIDKAAEYARALGMKISIVAYDDDDPKNIKGPINSDIFRIVWERMGKPRDFWSLEEMRLPQKLLVYQPIPVVLIGPALGKVTATCAFNFEQEASTLGEPLKRPAVTWLNQEHANA
jgi:transcriptional regulator with XRE-family HTH domain